MSRPVIDPELRSVLHILPEDMTRGAQSYARALIDLLDGGAERHRLVTLFRSTQGVAKPDLELDVPIGRLRYLGFDPRVVWRLRKLLAEESPQVVVAHGGEAAKYAALLKRPGRPLIYLMIGAGHPGLRRPSSRALYRWTLERCSRVVAVSDHVGAEARQLHDVPSERVMVIPNGRDPDVYRPGPPNSSVPRLVWVGQMEPAKRPGRFLDLVSTLVQRDADLEGWMAGDGPLLDDIESKAADTVIDVLGPRSDIPELLRGSDILVFTGGPPEGMPGVLVEAGLSGLPVVTTAVPGAAEVVEDRATGFVVDVDDFQALVESVSMLIGDPDLRRRMGERARERCVARFSLQHAVEEWRSLIAETWAAP